MIPLRRVDALRSRRALWQDRISMTLRLGVLLVMILPASVANGGALPGATIIDGSTVPFFLDAPTDRFRAFASREGELVPVPFQVDERGGRDRWIVDRGDDPGKDDSPGRFDENDALVVMNRDLGMRVEPAKLPEASSWAEVRVGEEASPLGWLYVALDVGEPPIAEMTDYSRYEPEAEQILATRYAAAFDGPLPSHVSLVEDVGDVGINILDGLRANGEARILAGLITLRRSEKDIGARLYGYRDGPVRVIRRSRYWIELPLGFKARAHVAMSFFRDFVQAETVARVDIPPRLVPATGELTAWFELLGQQASRLLIDANGMAPADLERATAFDGRAARWAALLLPGGRTFLLAVRREGALRHLEQRALVLPRLAGPAFGFTLSGVERLTTGDHDLAVFVAILDTTDPGAIRRAADVFLDPPGVSVTRLE